MRIKKYDNFINENMAQAKSIIAKKMESFEKLKNLLSKNVGYIGKFTDYLMYENIAYENLEQLYKQLIDLKSKNINLDINKLKYENVIDEIQKSYERVSINSLISKFPAIQKEFIKKLLNNSTNYNIVLKVSKKDNLENFISKISRYKTEIELENAMKIFSKDSINNREEIIKILDELESKIVIQNDNIMIIRVTTFNDIKILAPDSSWCILKQNMWSTYTTGRYQFIVLSFNKEEFDPNFKIGLTLNRDGTIHACHDLLDKSASIVLTEILNENNIKTYDLIANEVKPIEIDKINLRTSYVNLKTIATTCGIKDADKLLKRLFDVFAIGKPKPNNLTENKKDVIISVIRKIFINKINLNDFITEKDVKEVDERLLNFINNNYSYMPNSFNRCYIQKDKANFYVNDNALIKGLDIWSDKLIADNINHIRYDDFIKTNNDFTKPIEDKSLLKDKNIIIKLSDRLNEIYTNNNKLISESNKNNFAIRMLFLNCILNRKEKCPDHNIIKIPYYMIVYPGLFSKEVSPDTGLNFTSYNNKVMGNYPINLIEKKDYNDAIFTFNFSFNFSLVDKMMELIKHLDGYKLNIKLSKQSIIYIKNMKSSDKMILDIINMFETFNDRSRKSTEFKKNKLTIIVD